jgi:hypothetical protein
MFLISAILLTAAGATAGPGDWSPEAFLATPVQAADPAPAIRDPWWLMQLEVIGLGAGSESVVVSATGPIPGEVAQQTAKATANALPQPQRLATDPAPATGDSWWLQQLEAIGFAAGSESAVVSATGPTPGEVAQQAVAAVQAALSGRTRHGQQMASSR